MGSIPLKGTAIGSGVLAQRLPPESDAVALLPCERETSKSPGA